MWKQIIHFLSFLIFILLVIGISLIISGTISFSSEHFSINQHILSGINLSGFNFTTGSNYEFVLKQEQSRESVVSNWLSFLSILATLLAAFFIYSSWKIDNDLRRIRREYEKVNEGMKGQINDLQIQTEMYTMFNTAAVLVAKCKFEDALDTLDDLLRKDFVELDESKMYRVYKEIAQTHYEFGEWGDENKIGYENIANYENAKTSLIKAMELYKKEDDNIFLHTIEQKIESNQALKTEDEI